MTTARQIINLALESNGILGIGETLSADDADYYFRQLNLIVDKMSAGRSDLFKDQYVTGVVSGDFLTTGTGSFTAVSVGTEIQGMTADSFMMSPITFEQYRDIFDKTASGRPINYAYDGFNKIYLYPQATGNTITIQTRADITEFADLDTDYTFPSGYKSAFVACVAKVAAKAMNALTKDIKDEETEALKTIESANIRPLMLGHNTTNGKNILNGFNS